MWLTTQTEKYPNWFILDNTNSELLISNDFKSKMGWSIILYDNTPIWNWDYIVFSTEWRLIVDSNFNVLDNLSTFFGEQILNSDTVQTNWDWIIAVVYWYNNSDLIDSQSNIFILKKDLISWKYISTKIEGTTNVSSINDFHNNKILVRYLYTDYESTLLMKFNSDFTTQEFDWYVVTDTTASYTWLIWDKYIIENTSDYSEMYDINLGRKLTIPFLFRMSHKCVNWKFIVWKVKKTILDDLFWTWKEKTFIETFMKTSLYSKLSEKTALGEDYTHTMFIFWEDFNIIKWFENIEFDDSKLTFVETFDSNWVSYIYWLRKNNNWELFRSVIDEQWTEVFRRKFLEDESLQIRWWLIYIEKMDAVNHSDRFNGKSQMIILDIYGNVIIESGENFLSSSVMKDWSAITVLFNWDEWVTQLWILKQWTHFKTYDVEKNKHWFNFKNKDEWKLLCSFKNHKFPITIDWNNISNELTNIIEVQWDNSKVEIKGKKFSKSILWLK